jgi:centromere protein C
LEVVSLASYASPSETDTPRRTGHGNADATDGNGVEGNFTTRRSGRQHIAPLAHWRGEKVEYRRGVYGTEISGVVHVPVEQSLPLTGAAKRRRARSRSMSVRPKGGRGGGVAGGGGGGENGNGVWVHPEAGWDDMTQPLGKVIDFETGLETERREFLFELCSRRQRVVG